MIYQYDPCPEDLLRMNEESGYPLLADLAPEDWLRMEAEEQADG